MDEDADQETIDNVSIRAGHGVGEAGPAAAPAATAPTSAAASTAPSTAEEGEEEEEEKVDPRDLLTKEQVDYYKSIFATIDPDKKEKIPTKMICNVLRMLGFNPTKAELKKHMKEIDPQGKGTIDFAAFLLPIAQRINQEPETHEDIIAAFRAFDEELNGYVYTDILVDNLTSLAEDLDDLEVELLLKMAETKGTGKIHYVEFVEKMFGIVRKSSKKEKGEKKKGKKGGKKKK